MSLLALKNNLQVSAVAIGGPAVNLKELRQSMIEQVYKEVIPNFDQRGEEAMRERSAVYWPEKINAPLPILQGGADWRVNTATNALLLAQKLQGLGKTYELHIYAGDDHGLSFNSADGHKRAIAWFKRYMK